MTGADLTTVGVAVPVPEPFGSVLREARASFGDALAATVPTHVTLMPPLEVDDEALGRLPGALDEVAGRTPAFRMSLRGTGTFRPVSPVVYVALDDGAEATGVLAERARAAAGVDRVDFPFHPHVTVAHHLDDDRLDAAQAALAGFAGAFVVSHFALYRHDAERGWEPRIRFDLTGAA